MHWSSRPGITRVNSDTISFDLLWHKCSICSPIPMRMPIALEAPVPSGLRLPSKKGMSTNLSNILQKRKKDGFIVHCKKEIPLIPRFKVIIWVTGVLSPEKARLWQDSNLPDHHFQLRYVTAGFKTFSQSQAQFTLLYEARGLERVVTQRAL